MTFSLEVNKFSHSLFHEHMVASSTSFLETEPNQQCSEIIEADVGI